MSQEFAILARLANRLNYRGTKTAYGLLRRLGLAFPRDWRDVARRYLRRHSTAAWHVGGHHIASLDGQRIMIAETSAKGALYVDGRAVALAVV